MTPIAKDARIRTSRVAQSPERDRERRARTLWRAYARKPGDAPRNLLVEHYQPFVREVVRRFGSRLPRSVERGDLETAANVGLIGAIESFDATRGVRFESYCELRVRGALLDELRTQDWLPRPWRTRIERHKRVCEELRAALGREPTDDEIARGMDLDPAEYRQLFSTGVPLQPTGSGGDSDGHDDEAHGIDVVADTHSDAPGEKLSREELLRLVAQKLSDQEYRIVYLRYWEELPMREIGQLEGLSESRVCKIHQRLIERLKDRLRANATE
ncbi:MAG: sigma-70 family RNA polymerase sigma factor [Planctomycetes bacterium]|jgi:RNA polymerase sigma factor for flagellar operon FliA|nr:sigma-70 family RNA polymerase sigma factor [Planctomycetota bacterium]